MVGSASVLDPSLAPEGGHTLWISSFAPYHRRDGRTWDEAEEAFAECLLDRLSLYAPNVRDTIIASELTSPVDWQRRTGSIRGNPNHLDMTLDQILKTAVHQSQCSQVERGGKSQTDGQVGPEREEGTRALQKQMAQGIDGIGEWEQAGD